MKTVNSLPHPLHGSNSGFFHTLSIVAKLLSPFVVPALINIYVSTLHKNSSLSKAVWTSMAVVPDDSVATAHALALTSISISISIDYPNSTGLSSSTLSTTFCSPYFVHVVYISINLLTKCEKITSLFLQRFLFF